MAPVFYTPAAVSLPRHRRLDITQRRGWRQLVRRWQKERGHPKSDVLFYLERATRLELVTGIPKMASGHFQEPCRISD